MRRLIGFALLLIGISSCEELAPAAEMPVYILVEDISVIDLSNQRVNSPPGIRDLWVYDRQAFQGAYDASTVFPIIPSKDGTLRLEAGIYVDGLSAFRRAYPFLQSAEIDISDATPTDTLSIKPVFSYFPSSAITIPFSETFENGSSKLVSTINDPNSTRISVTNSDSFLGNASGKINFNSSQNLMLLQTNEFFPLPQGNAEDVFLEISYKNSIPFNVGVNSVSTSGAESLTHPVTYKGSDKWNTVFVYLTPLLDNVPLNSVFQLFISANGGGNSGSILIDNVRIIHLSP